MKDPNKLASVEKYLQRKEEDETHLTVEVRILEQQMKKVKDGVYHFVYLIHLNAINVQAYFYFIHSDSNLIEEREVYILQNVNIMLKNTDYIMILSNPQTQIIPMIDDTMSLCSFKDENEEATEKAGVIANELAIKKPFNSWKECRKLVFRNYNDILSSINVHVDIKQLSLIKHILIWVIPSLIKPIEISQSKMQNKFYRIFNYDQIKCRIKDTKVSFIGIIKTIIRVSICIFLSDRNFRKTKVRTRNRWIQRHC